MQRRREIGGRVGTRAMVRMMRVVRVIWLVWSSEVLRDDNGERKREEDPGGERGRKEGAEKEARGHAQDH